MEDRFSYLMRLYLDKTASEQDREELKDLICTGEYEQDIKEQIANLFYEEPEEKELISVNQTDTDELYKKIMAEVREMREIPAINKKVLNRERFSVLFWAAAALAIGVSLAWWLTLRPDSGLLETTPTSLTNEEIRYTQKDFIYLPDGSTVQLNEKSELLLLSSFGTKTREVTLSGEAFFDIKPDSLRPFIIHTGKIKTKVLGTSFNVNASSGFVSVTVTKGLVEVGNEHQVFSTLKPKEQIKIDTTAGDFELTSVEPEKVLRWKAENLIFDNISLDESMELIGKRFGVNVTIKNDTIGKCRITAWFLNGETLDEVLNIISRIRQTTYTIENEHVYVTGGIPCD